MTQDNIAVSVTCPGITIPSFNHNQTTAAYSDEPGKFIFKEFTGGCGSISYTIGTRKSSGEIPVGLTG